MCGRAAERLAGDHCHLTGKGRDWLCTNCNVGLGHFKDDPALLRKAAAYIERHLAYSDPVEEMCRHLLRWNPKVESAELLDKVGIVHQPETTG